MITVGIDPGLDGGIVALDGQGAIGIACPMPTLAIPGGVGGKRDYDLESIRRLIEGLRGAGLPLQVGIERQQAMPGQGVTSTFQTGKGFGLLLGLMAGLRVASVVVSARTWQAKAFAGFPAGDGTKDLSILACQRRWPGRDWRASERCRKGHDGMTDAALIAEHIRTA